MSTRGKRARKRPGGNGHDPTGQEAYYRSLVLIAVDRISLLQVLGCCVAALALPGLPAEMARDVRHLMRRTLPLVDRYLAPEIRASWLEELRRE